MKFVQLTSAEFSKYAAKSPYKSFLQTTEIAELREKNGWTAYYFGIEKDNKIIAAAMLVARPTFLGKSTYYIPGGPLLNYEDTTLVNYFFKNLKNYAKSHNGYLLHIEPYYELIQRDREGQPVVGGFNRQKALKNLQNLGFVSVKSDNPKYLFILDLKGAKEDQLFASFKQNTRNLISRTARKGVTVRELGREELVKFKQITESTSERRHFSDKPLSYYETMYDLFAKKGEVKFIIAEIEKDNVQSSEDNSSADKKTIIGPEGIRSLARRGRAPAAHARLPLGTQTTRRVDGPVGRGPKVDNSFESDLVPISAAMFMTYGDEVIYLFSGSDEKYMKEYNAQYAIQWYMIKYALKNHFKKYNFYGIQGLPDPDKPGYGIYKFKKGFTIPENGRVIEQIGAYELPVNSFFYGLHKILSKIKHAK